MSEGSLKNLLNGSNPYINGWKLLRQTLAAALELGDSERLVGLKRPARPSIDGEVYPNLLDPVSYGAPPVMVLRSCAASMPDHAHLTTEPTLAWRPAQEPTANAQVHDVPMVGAIGGGAAT
mmetsp:Transcript_22132/g.47780  ORF Transcript_22132/g.47780 Transcript_22132/m.47780 type:complete len:121 (-) Transcript_22132:215-577(-)